MYNDDDENKVLIDELAALSLFAISPLQPVRNPWGRFQDATKTTAVYVDKTGKILTTPTAFLDKHASKLIDSHSPAGETGTPNPRENQPALSRITKESKTKLNFNGIYAQKGEGQLVLYADVERDEHYTTVEDNKLFLEAHFHNSNSTSLSQHYDSETAPNPIKKRYRSQLKTMGYSATVISRVEFAVDAVLETLEQLDLTDEQKEGFLYKFAIRFAEWCHEIDYSKGGEAKQVPENLFYGTREANSVMMVSEAYTNKLKAEGKLFTIDVEAILIDSEHHIPWVLKVTIQEEGKSEPTIIIIDPFETKKPIKQAVQYFELNQKGVTQENLESFRASRK